MITKNKVSVFEELPGLMMPIADIGHTLSEMWSGQAGTALSTGFRATQMNLVIQFGLQTTVEQAKRCFDTAISFGQRYPCRIFILCPMGRARSENSEKLLQGKLFSQCYIGPDLRDMCCCEAIILGYPTREANFISNLISVWLENDLPIYLWLHRVPEKRIREVHMDLVQQSHRVIYDYSLEGDAYAQLKWPEGERVVDLALARILPIRQSVGQFLSSFEPKILVSGLQKLVVRANSKYIGEGQNLLNWSMACLKNCARQAKDPIRCDFNFELGTQCEEQCLEMIWIYQNNQKFFQWSHKDGERGVAIKANLGNGLIEVPMQVPFLDEDKALSEALFFA